MKPPPQSLSPRAEELLVRRALEGLDEAEAAELRALGADDDHSYDLAAAAAALATVVEEAMPEGLEERILARTSGATARVTPAPRVLPARPPAARGGQLGWAAAAICLVVAVAALLAGQRPRPTQLVYVPAPAPPPPVVAPPPTPLEERLRLLRTSRDARPLPWTATADPAARGASGDVVWSASAQRGFMRFVGVSANDRRQAQYQLWIFDKQRDARYPVDGGVFDVASSGEVIVPITARLPVGEATLFAVTVEKPGGVVVSRRERIVLTADLSHG